MDTGDKRPEERGRLAPGARADLEWPFCGDEYPPLKGSPGAVVCTKPRHPPTEIHLNEETGWVWRSGQESRRPHPDRRAGGPR